ncbi:MULTISPECIES: flagellar hook capping FlgD N-terminal domain-containing protein [unclassified Fusibacter]|uniref:flagellar hook capping FlgD N-terminal domain-containing protein n=1 Tax=unclassified Fusibacter TaxID=2624464 RepID=UPI001010354F|nr:MULTISPECIES: flagellar hook capping FlgD N-terminal domain-containing protein [unclassified Fusibacter]MCK8058761.1 flagellar hook capping protein [Fusibacter sp. A2]NPE21835.1 flagellar hook capping protein [Fusibacter sp. A1]RXV61407.1 flagellar hook capping protein [Fusibacter sp. A1]
MAIGSATSAVINGSFTEQQIKYLEQIEQKAKTDKLTQNQDMGKDQFLHILLTQLSNQNPMDPLQDKDFIAQMAQFSSLENMQAMNETFGEVKEDLGDIKLLLQKQASSTVSTEQTDVLNTINESLGVIQNTQLAQLNLLMNQASANEAYE